MALWSAGGLLDGNPQRLPPGIQVRPQTEENICSTSRLRSLLPPGGSGRKHAAAEEHLSSSSSSSPPSAFDCYLQMERCHFLFWVRFLDPSVSSD